MSFAEDLRTVGLQPVRLLGAGAMGEVWEAEQLDLKRRVAVKRIRIGFADDPIHSARFAREAQAIARVSSPHVVTVHALLTIPGERLLVMELIPDGCSLRRAMHGPIEWSLATSAIRQVAEGLQAAHAAEVIHRDIKPDNVLITREGVVKLADFGLSRVLDASQLTTPGGSLGTPAYMAPEIWAGRTADAASDLYSLGCTWYHLLAGRPPIPGSSLAELALNHQQHQPTPLRDVIPAIPAPIAALVQACLEKDPARRPTSARALVDSMHALSHEGLAVRRTVPELFAAGMSRTDQRQAGNVPPQIPSDSVLPTALRFETEDPPSSNRPSPMAATLPTPVAPDENNIPTTAPSRRHAQIWWLGISTVLVVILMMWWWPHGEINAHQSHIAASKIDAQDVDRLDHILELMRTDQWNEAHQALGQYISQTSTDQQRMRGQELQQRLERSARTTVEQAIEVALNDVNVNRIAEARTILENARVPAAICGYSEQITAALSKLPAK